MAKRRRRRNPATARKQNARSSRLANFLAGSALFALVLLTGLVEPHVVLPRCAYSATSGVVSNLRFEGKLVRGWGEFYVQDVHGNEHIVAKCRRGNCSEVYRQLQRAPAGAQISAEFCGPFLTFLFVNHVSLHASAPPTQERIDEQAAAVRWIGLLVLIYLVAVGTGIAIYAVKKTRGARARR